MPVGRFGFPKALRLTKRREYLAVQNRGRKHHLTHLLAFVLPREDRTVERAASSRFGITVSGKVGNAVARNRVKRLLREVIRYQHGELPGGLEIVFIAKKNAVTASLAELKRQVAELGRRLSRRGRARNEQG